MYKRCGRCKIEIEDNHYFADPTEEGGYNCFTCGSLAFMENKQQRYTWEEDNERSFDTTNG